jgi:hypothetical protein
MSAELELQIVREALENVLSSRTAAAVLFEALSKRGGDIPASREQLVSFLRGELRETLAVRQGPESVQLLHNIERMLERPSARGLDSTREVPILAKAVLVFVLAGNKVMARTIEAALGPGRVTVHAVTSAETFRAAVEFETPAIVILECASFPPIEPTDIAVLLGALPENTVRAVSGIDTPYGSAALAALSNTRVACTPIDRREGIEPLLDLIRSRRR